jgi:hypothetical protein
MSGGAGPEFVAECFWPGVSEDDLNALDARAAKAAKRLAAEGGTVRYLGSLLFQEDEVVLCMFAGEEPAVRETAVAASIPFERIVASSRSPRALAARGEEGER